MLTGATSYINYSECGHVLPPVPLTEGGELIGTEHQHQLHARLVGLQCLQRVNGVAGAVTANFAVIDNDLSHAFKGQPRHGEAVFGCAQRARLVPRLASRHDVKHFEPGLGDGGPGKCDMGVVGRVERAAEDPDSPAYHAVSPASLR